MVCAGSTCAEFHNSPGKTKGTAFLRGVAAFPCQTRRALTNNGAASTKNTSTKWDTVQHPFNRVCDGHGTEHRLTKPDHPWTHGQAERTNRTVKDATTKALRWRTPFQAICDAWKANPSVFKINPHRHIPGLNIYDFQFVISAM